MAGVVSITTSISISGLGTSTVNLSNTFTGTVPTKMGQQYRVLAVADTEEALDLGDVSTVEGVLIRAVLLDLDIDTSYTPSTFVKEINLAAGESIYLKPEGAEAIYVKNGTGAETPSYEYVVFGT